MRKYVLLTILLLSIAAGGVVWRFRDPVGGWILARWRGAEAVLVKRPKPDPKTYARMTQELEDRRKELGVRHKKARTAAERAAVEKEARNILESSLPRMMRCWLGTPWDFNGTAKGPGEGKIACGYFVATVLKDAGFQVDRYQLAQQASGNILRSFLPKESCDLSVGREYNAFAGDVAKREPGVYVIGLDSHVAFIVVRDGGFRFIHSSGSQPWCVVDESPTQAGVLQRSKWRMLGNLTADEGVLRHWLRAEKIVVKGT